jgi:replicative DNA helicase
MIDEAQESGADDTTLHISDCTRKTIEALKNPQAGIGTGIPKLDAVLRGLKPGELYIVAGRPGMGKTTMGLTLALNVAISRRKVLFNSLEMPQEQLTQRLLSRLSGECVHSGEPYNADKVDEAKRTLDPLPLYVDDKAGLTVTDIVTRARRHKRKRGLDVLLIDYLQIIASEDKRPNMVHQLAEITGALKRLAKDLKIPVVLLSQLSRAVEDRDNRRPVLRDLRDSGAIEQDADVVMLLYREEYYQSEAHAAAKPSTGFKGSKEKQAAQLADFEALKGKAEVIIAKYRQGRMCTVHLGFDGERQWFHD